MRVVLRNPQTGLFFRNTDDWTDRLDGARDFAQTATALFFAEEQKLLGLEILLTFDNPEHDFVIGVT